VPKRVPTESSILARYRKEQDALVKLIARGGNSRAPKLRGALEPLRLAVRVYTQQLATLERIAGYVDAGLGQTKTLHKHEIKRTVKALRLQQALLTADRYLNPVTNTQKLRLREAESTPELEELRATALQARELLGRHESVDREALAFVQVAAKRIQPGRNLRPWSTEEDAMVVAGCLEIEGRTYNAILTRRSRLGAPRRAEDRRLQRRASAVVLLATPENDTSRQLMLPFAS